MKELYRLLQQRPSAPVTPERAVRVAEFVVLEGQGILRAGADRIRIHAVLRLRDACRDAASPRLTGPVSEGVWLVLALLTVVAWAIGLGPLTGRGGRLGRSQVRALPLEEAAPLVLGAAVAGIVLAGVQVWLRRRAHDPRDYSMLILYPLAVCYLMLAGVMTSRVDREQPDDEASYLLIAALALGAALAQFGAARYAQVTKRRLNAPGAPPRPRLARPRSPDRRIERIVSRSTQQLHALLAAVPEQQHRRLQKRLHHALDDLRRRGVLDEEDLAAARGAAFGLASITLAADRARRGVLDLDTLA